MFGIVQGRSGSPFWVCGGGGALRSRPKSRRTRPRPKIARAVGAVGEEPGGTLRSLPHRQLVLGPGTPLGGLDHAVGEDAAPDDDSQRAAEQLGVGELLARAGGAIVVED